MQEGNTMRCASRIRDSHVWGRALFALLVAVNGFALPSWAEITFDGNAVVFENGPDRTQCVEAVKRIVPFEKHLRLDQPLSSIPHSLLFNMKRSIIQGVKVSVPPGKGFAVVVSYVCSKPLLAAEVPFECDSSIAVVDPTGCVRSKLKGDYLWVVAHENLPYFALIRDYCCDVTGRATLFDLAGNKVCEGYIGKEPPFLTGKTFTCGTTWRDGKLLDGRDVSLE